MVVPEKNDITIPQGIAHAVDRVMFPLPVGDILQTLQSDRERRFTKFLEALTTSGMSELLQNKGKTIYIQFILILFTKFTSIFFLSQQKPAPRRIQCSLRLMRPFPTARKKNCNRFFTTRTRQPSSWCAICRREHCSRLACDFIKFVIRWTALIRLRFKKQTQERSRSMRRRFWHRIFLRQMA